MWDADSGKSLLTWEEPQGQVHCACYSPDGKQLAAMNMNKVEVYDTAHYLTLTGETYSIFPEWIEDRGPELARVVDSDTQLESNEIRITIG